MIPRILLMLIKNVKLLFIVLLIINDIVLDMEAEELKKLDGVLALIEEEISSLSSK
jgi:hypothetical protein